ncbi:Ulp1 protease family [Hirschfeldia incana]|nr:Ulp1 protease family [Hirschfeldia incana]
MNHNCHLANLQMVEKVVGVDAWESIKTSSVGVILRLKELTSTWWRLIISHFGKSLVYPYVGKSTVKRIIKGDSKAYYDPLAKAAETKFKKLMDYLGSLEAMRDPSPYSARIAFLEHWFVNMWVGDYKKYDPKMWKFSDSYEKVFNGNYPQEFSNNRNIQTVVPSTPDLLEECRPFTKMILLLLKEMFPEKKSTQQFRISRLKNVPQNEKLGDCGVYALKYIECKAIGCGFEGLSDECIPAMRIKLAAEIYDEVPGL